MGTSYVPNGQATPTTGWDLVTAVATPLQTEYQLTASSLNSSFIVWRCALGHCPVVGGTWLQSSAVHRVWHGVPKWSVSLSYSKSPLPCTNFPLYPLQSSPRPSHYLQHAWQMVSGTPPASFHVFCVSQMFFCVIQTPQTFDLSVHNTFFKSSCVHCLCSFGHLNLFLLLTSLRYG